MLKFPALNLNWRQTLTECQNSGPTTRNVSFLNDKLAKLWEVSQVWETQNTRGSCYNVLFLFQEIWLSALFGVLQKWQTSHSCAEQFGWMILFPAPGGTSCLFWMTLWSFVNEKLVFIVLCNGKAPRTQHMRNSESKNRLYCVCCICNYVSRSSQSSS